MVWTSDHPAQCKMGAMKSGAYSGCQCYCVTSRWCTRSGNKGLVEYHDNIKQKRHPFVVLCVKNMAFSLKQWQELPMGREKDEVRRKVAISSQSCFWRLYNLYNFDIFRDVTCDVMHTLALCAFKKYVHLTCDVMHTLGLCAFKKYVHVFVKYAERNGKIKDLDFKTSTCFLCFVNVSTNML